MSSPLLWMRMTVRRMTRVRRWGLMASRRVMRVRRWSLMASNTSILKWHVTNVFERCGTMILTPRMCLVTGLRFLPISHCRPIVVGACGRSGACSRGACGLGSGGCGCGAGCGCPGGCVCGAFGGLSGKVEVGQCIAREGTHHVVIQSNSRMQGSTVHLDDSGTRLDAHFNSRLVRAPKRGGGTKTTSSGTGGQVRRPIVENSSTAAKLESYL